MLWLGAAYRRVFSGPDADLVLGDLIAFCHAADTTHVPGDPVGSALLEGRRQVWLRIQARLRIDEATVDRLIAAEKAAREAA